MSFQSRESRVIRVIKWVAVGIAGLLTLLVLVAIAVYFWMRASVPTLDGTSSLAGLRQSVSVTRDAAGIVAIKADDVLDAVRALGYVHGQERFFEMDLARRSAAGELSALLGKATLPMDRDKRRHRMRVRAAAEWARAPEIEKAWFTAYTEGVNAGVAALGARPWQYLVLRSEPQPWQPVDSLLVLSEMYFMLQSGGFESRFADIRLRALLGNTLFDWMRPTGGAWDATLDGVVPAFPAMPGPEAIDTRKATEPKVPAVASRTTILGIAATDLEALPGSNNWAVSGARTADGRAILADDMHLGLNVPGIWFRAEMRFKHAGREVHVAGVTLPGIPQVAAGSNGSIAWGFTNSYGQWFDWVAVPKSGGEVRTVTETILVKGADKETLDVRELPIGSGVSVPVLKTGADSDYALAWMLYQPGAMMTRADAMMLATTMDEALRLARETPMPHQNLMIVDNKGNAAWTIVGRIPDRKDWSVKRGTTRAVDALPQGWVSPDVVPVVKNPAGGVLWTANSRQLGGKGSEIIGDGGFDLGARGMQIRDRLLATPKHDESSLYAIQLDSESRFLKRWGELINTRAAAPSTPPPVAALHAEVKRWNGRADVDQTGHRVVRAFRERVMAECWRAWLGTRDPNAVKTDGPEKSDAGLSHDGRFEYAVWQAITTQPAHLLPKGHFSWDHFLDVQLKWVHDDLVKQHGSLANATWGTRNTSRIKHPFSRAMPFLSPYLDMPPRQLAGDNHMPRVAAPTFGASQRLVVSPGKEAEGILTVAGGQSGHPLSPFYGAGHREWLEGAKQPLLAGPTIHTLKLEAGK